MTTVSHINDNLLVQVTVEGQQIQAQLIKYHFELRFGVHRTSQSIHHNSGVIEHPASLFAVCADAALLLLGHIKIGEHIVERPESAELAMLLAQVAPHGLDVHQPHALPMVDPTTSSKGGP